MTCPPCTHDCNEGRNCPLIAINAQVVGYVAPQRTWVGLTSHERMMCRSFYPDEAVAKTEAKLKEKNT
jgi:hypothetical protein